MRLYTAFALAGIAALPPLALADGLDRVLGKALFDRVWVAAPASTRSDDGLGPLFNEKSCAACHSGKALAARLHVDADGSVAARGLVTRLGDADGAIDPVYGRQIQPRSVPGLSSEGTVDYVVMPEHPTRILFTPAFGPLAAQTRMGARLAPPLVGIGRIGAVDEAALKAEAALAKPNGVKGRLHILADGRIGRYGWKAGAPTLEQQVADAFDLDIGLSSPLVPRPQGDCTAAETACLAMPDGRDAISDGEEISNQILALVTTYLDRLPAPQPPADSAGAALFAATGCADCHRPTLAKTGGGSVTLYSDLLLHDLGPGLDDGVGEPGVASFEWRTPPLIALSLRQGEDGHYLHDGRAATLDAAIRAHGGEASQARVTYSRLSDQDRSKLIAFLETL